MPAVTVENTLTLPRISSVDAAVDVPRPVVSVTSAPSGLEGEGFPVRRAFAGVDLRALDPFIHMDQMGEVEYAPGEPKGTPWHPHRGFETVTYMIDGLMQHQDSNGGGGLIVMGDTQWMTAGAGILHIETPPELRRRLRWSLPRASAVGQSLRSPWKFAPPRYQDITSAKVALLSSPDGGALVRLIHGDLGDAGPGVAYPPITLLTRRSSLPVSGFTPSRRSSPGLRPVRPRVCGCRAASPVVGPARGFRRRLEHHDQRRLAARRARLSVRRLHPRRAAHSRAGRCLRTVCHEHQGRTGPGVRRLPGRTPRQHSCRN